MLILGKDISLGSRCMMSCCDLDLTFELVIMTINFKLLSGLYLEKRKVYKVNTRQGHWWGCGCAMSWCDPDLTFDLALLTLSFKSCLGYISISCFDTLP